MNNKPRLTILSTALAFTLIAAGCASVSTPPPALVEARSAVSTASSNPNVLANAPLELKKANDALARADQALSKGDEPEVNHNAYLATQRARTAIAAGDAKAAEDMIKSAQVERERVRADAREREARRATTSALVARADARDARADAEIQRAQNAAAQQQAAAANDQAATAQAQAASAQAQTASAEARAASLERQLAALEALKTDRGMVITLGDVLFEFNRAEVKPSTQSRIAELANFLKQYPDRRVSIEGHTDNIGSAAYNDELSLRRADAIKSQLVNYGIPSERISTAGYGKDFPVAANDTDTNRAINRRVEVVISEPGQTVRSRR
ncbi:MAG: OmpA family protein [Betaproteobacteria bacterium]